MDCLAQCDVPACVNQDHYIGVRVDAGTPAVHLEACTLVSKSEGRLETGRGECSVHGGRGQGW